MHKYIELKKGNLDGTIWMKKKNIISFPFPDEILEEAPKTKVLSKGSKDRNKVSSVRMISKPKIGARIATRHRR